MIFTARHAARCAAIGLIVAGTCGLASEAQADFFGDLFGLSAPAPVQPAPETNVGARAHGNRQRPVRQRVAHRHPKSEKASKVAANLTVQRTTDIFADKTLRPGDAVMTKDGIRIYAGDTSSSSHEASDFVPLADAHHVKKSARLALAAIDTAKGLDVGRTLNIASGRSVAVESAKSSNITPRDGGTAIRYVGP